MALLARPADPGASHRHFDAAEYIDRMQALGCELLAMRYRNGKWGWWQSEPMGLRPQERLEERPLHPSVLGGPDAGRAVVDELIRRGKAVCEI